MSMQLAPTRMSLPPPTRLDLVDAQRTVGWITGQALGFHGFSDERDAANAAWVAYRTVCRRLAQLWGTRPIPIDVEPLTLARQGGREFIFASRRPVAELLRPRVDSPSGPESFGFEILVSPSVAESMMRDLTRLAYRALRKSGTRWAMWRPRVIGKTTAPPEAETLPWDHRIEETPVARMSKGFTRASGAVAGALASLTLLLLTLVISVSLLVVAFLAPQHFVTMLVLFLFATLFVLRVVVLLGNWLPTRSGLRDWQRRSQRRAEHFYRRSLIPSPAAAVAA